MLTRLSPHGPSYCRNEAVSADIKTELTTERVPSHWVAHDSASGEHPAPRGWAKNAFAVAQALFSTEQGPPPEERLRWLTTELRDFLSHIGARARIIYRLSLFLVVWLAPFWGWRLPPLRWLSVERRIRILNRFERSLFGAPLLAVKAILCILYYEHPEAAKAIGFDGKCHEDKELES